MEHSIVSPMVLSVLLFSLLLTSANADKQSYIVYMGEHSYGLHPTLFDIEKVTNSHYSLLSSILYRCINGFAAVIDEKQAEEIRKQPNVISVFPNQERKLHTTHSWDFMGMDSAGLASYDTISKDANFGEDVIIANLDTGVWPESKSFSDEGYGAVPSRWRGTCQQDGGFRCNRKLIGARYFNKGFTSSKGPFVPEFNTARDTEGHGSHTLSTAGGNFVPGASVFGIGNGTARGGSPKARVAAYKVCWPSAAGGCFDADILAAFDAAIGDGVDVISMSVGGNPTEFYQDAIALGSYHAVRKGIVVVVSAGNEGPGDGTVTNVAPWMLTVGASTIDREFAAYVRLGRKKILKGSSLATKSLPPGKFYKLIDAADARAANATPSDAEDLSLRGIIARLDKGHEAQLAGAVGMILANDEQSGGELVADLHMLPAAHINFTDGEAVFSYIKSSRKPKASISHVMAGVGIKPNPTMAAFSSRGPSTIEPALLKPDITAPGVNIIAAYIEATGPSEAEYDTCRTPYTVMSGTSMSCPHVSGIVGLLRKIHPDWSPAAIKSAIMTAAKTRANNRKAIRDETLLAANPFSYGAGHVQPNPAADPGLVYDLTTNDYLNFLSAHGYNQSMLKAFSEVPYACPKQFTLADFNYPSITIPNLNGQITVMRTVKNVGTPGTCTARVKAPYTVSAVVEPTSLTFTKTGEEKTFKVAFNTFVKGSPKAYSFGQLIWSDGQHHVKSPLVVKHL